MGISESRMRKLMEGPGPGRPGVAGKVGELVETIRGGGWCEEQGSLMRGFAFGILDPQGERYRLALAHQRECPACRAYVLSLRGLAAVLPPRCCLRALGASAPRAAQAAGGAGRGSRCGRRGRRRGAGGAGATGAGATGAGAARRRGRGRRRGWRLAAGGRAGRREARRRLPARAGRRRGLRGARAPPCTARARRLAHRHERAHRRRTAAPTRR